MIIHMKYFVKYDIFTQIIDCIKQIMPKFWTLYITYLKQILDNIQHIWSKF